jgi:excinuclease ABC subunit B
VKRPVTDILEDLPRAKQNGKKTVAEKKADLPVFKTQAAKTKHLARLEKQMMAAADKLDFEEAARLRDAIATLQMQELLG